VDPLLFLSLPLLTISCILLRVAFLHHPICIILCYIPCLHSPRVGLIMLRRYLCNNIGLLTCCNKSVFSIVVQLCPPNASVPIFSHSLPIPKAYDNVRADRMETLPTTFSAEAYFETQPPPSTIEQDVQSVRTFLEQQREHRRKVVLVTVRIPTVSHREPGVLILVGCVAEWRNNCSLGTQCVSKSTRYRSRRSP